jgi:hypothetical protein
MKPKRTVYENGLTGVKGAAQYKKFLDGLRLTKSEQIVAFCYDCMGGYADGVADCKTPECPLYDSHPYNPNKFKRGMSDKQKENFRNMAKKNPSHNKQEKTE